MFIFNSNATQKNSWEGRGGDGIPYFDAVIISWFKLFYVLPIVCTFFLPHRVHLLFCMVPHRVHLFTFYSNIGKPHFTAVKISWFKIFLCYPSCALFSAPSCVVIIFNGVPSSAPD